MFRPGVLGRPLREARRGLVAPVLRPEHLDLLESRVFS